MENFRKILEDILKGSGNQKPIFLSEADFQFYLAWQIKEKLKGKGKGEVILEYPDDIEDENGKKRRIYYDIWVEDESGKTHLIELKYRTKEQKDVMRYGKKFDLKNQSAHDLGRYHFMADIKRLEDKTGDKKIATGKSYCIMLTNDPLYEAGEKATNDRAFRFGSRINQGKHNWEKPDKDYCKKLSVIELDNNYEIKWKPYCTADGGGTNSEFKYLLLEIPPEKVDGHNHKVVNHG